MVTQNYVIPNEGADSDRISVKLTGHLYRNNNTYIYFEKPDYLQQLVQGNLPYENKGNNYRTLSLSIDTMQEIYYTNYDSLVTRFRSELYGHPVTNYLQKFDPDFLTWELSPETKKINDLLCQKATLIRYGQLQWIVWFCSSIPMKSGMSFIKGVPGLVVEADFVPIKKHYELTGLNKQQILSDTVFWPAVFNEPFSKAADLKKSKETKSETKKMKQLELLKQ